MSERRREAAATGARTLEIFSGTPRLNEWMASRLIARVHGDVLEIGSGIGNLSVLLRERAEHLVVSDVEHEYVEALGEQFAADDRVAVAHFDLDGEPPLTIAARRYDAIVAVNIIEHIADDDAAVQNLARLLKPGGHLLIYVPALPLLFGSLDEALGHQRRYTRTTLAALMRQAKLEVVWGPRYMNLLGIPGWFFSGRVLRQRQLDKRLISLFEMLVPLVRREDRFELPFGLGVIVHARRVDAAEPAAE